MNDIWFTLKCGNLITDDDGYVTEDVKFSRMAHLTTTKAKNDISCCKKELHYLLDECISYINSYANIEKHRKLNEVDYNFKFAEE